MHQWLCSLFPSPWVCPFGSQQDKCKSLPLGLVWPATANLPLPPLLSEAHPWALAIPLPDSWLLPGCPAGASPTTHIPHSWVCSRLPSVSCCISHIVREGTSGVASLLGSLPGALPPACSFRPLPIGAALPANLAFPPAPRKCLTVIECHVPQLPLFAASHLSSLQPRCVAWEGFSGVLYCLVGVLCPSLCYKQATTIYLLPKQNNK